MVKYPSIFTFQILHVPSAAEVGAGVVGETVVGVFVVGAIVVGAEVDGTTPKKSYTEEFV